MLILSRVCAEFHNAKGEKLFAVTPATRNIFVEAPDAVREDPLFRMLINDGSLEAAVPEERRKMLESDPAADHDASGKLIPSVSEEAEPKAKPNKPTRTGKAAKAEKSDENGSEPATQA